jgi:uncharacterized protein
MSFALTNWQETALNFECAGASLWGIVTTPVASGPSSGADHAPAKEAASQTGIVIIVGGPQYRTGSHRQFVLSSRYLAGHNYSVLRFDYRGIGDSAGEIGHFERVSADVRAAIDALLRCHPHLKRVVLWGLCDGASAALLYHHQERDNRVVGMVLLNPWVRSVSTEAVTRVKHYYPERLKNASFWRKLLAGKVAGSAAGELLRSLGLMLQGRGALQEPAHEPKTFQERMAAAWRDFDRPVLLVLSGNDHTAREFEEACATQPVWSGALARSTVTRYDAITADHTFSSREARHDLDVRTATWLRSCGL